MSIRSTEQAYGKLAVALHWVAAVLIMAMIPIGFLMQEADARAVLLLYSAHAGVGGLVLVLTAVRLLWKFIDVHPAPAPGLAGLHLVGMKVVHVLLYLLLYLLLIGLLISGVVLNIQGGLFEVLKSGLENEIPDFTAYRARTAHGALVWIYIALLAAHIGGVVMHQVRHGHVLARMGIGRSAP